MTTPDPREALRIESDGDDRHVLGNGTLAVVVYGTRQQAEICAAALAAEPPALDALAAAADALIGDWDNVAKRRALADARLTSDVFATFVGSGPAVHTQTNEPQDAAAIVAAVNLIGPALAVVGRLRDMAAFYDWDDIPYGEHGLPEKYCIDAIAAFDAALADE